MEEILKELVVGSPAVVAVIVVVVLFLRASKERDATMKEISKDFTDASREHTEESKKLRETLGVNSEILKQCQEKLVS